jgi:chorismate dehydratase
MAKTRYGLRVSSIDPWAPLRTLRIGCVQYLNSLPLISAYDGPVTFEHPSCLAGMLAAQSLDIALVPVFEALRGGNYILADGAAVSCDGPVFSVFLAYRGELSAIRSIALDPASLTSVHLLRVLLAEYHSMNPTYGAEGEAQLLIGNQAIDFRMQHDSWNYLDLGEEWKRCTGLPFVFALWVMQPHLAEPRKIADALRELKMRGVQQIPSIVQQDTFATPEIRQRYLTEYIHYDIGKAGKVAIHKYAELLIKYGYIPQSSKVPIFV